MAKTPTQQVIYHFNKITGERHVSLFNVPNQYKHNMNEYIILAYKNYYNHPKAPLKKATKAMLENPSDWEITSVGILPLAEAKDYVNLVKKADPNKYI